MGTPASIRASVEPQMDAWEVEPFGGQDLGDAADGIRELGLIGQDGNQRALGQVAVADLAAARACGVRGPSPTEYGGKL